MDTLTTFRHEYISTIAGLESARRERFLSLIVQHVMYMSLSTVVHHCSADRMVRWIQGYAEGQKDVS